MKQILNILILVLLILSSKKYGLTKYKEFKNLILGSIYSFNKNVNADTICNMLLGFKSNIILTRIEEDEKYHDYTYRSLYNESKSQYSDIAKRQTIIIL